MSIHRRIYEQHYGPIPREPNGRSYEIHHINGDHSDNRPENLIALSIQEHFYIHWLQGDWWACLRIAAKMEKSPEELSELARLINRTRIKNGTHNWLDGEKQRKNQLKRVEKGTHHFLDRDAARKTAQRRVRDGSHHLLGGDIQRRSNRKRLTEGTHNFLRKYICPHCQKEGRGPGMLRYHFDNCKKKAQQAA